MKKRGKEGLKKIGKFVIPLTLGVACIAVHIIRKNMNLKLQIAGEIRRLVKEGDELYLILNHDAPLCKVGDIKTSKIIDPLIMEDFDNLDPNGSIIGMMLVSKK